MSTYEIKVERTKDQEAVIRGIQIPLASIQVQGLE